MVAMENQKRSTAEKKKDKYENPLVPFGTSNLWQSCVDTCLTKASTGSYEIHDKVLDILAIAGSKRGSNRMSSEDLGKAVDRVLVATKKSRKLQRKKKEASGNYVWECDPINPGTAEAEKPHESKEAIAIQLRKNTGSQSPFAMDDLRMKYSQFSTNYGITEKDAPVLFNYLYKKENKLKRSRSGLGMDKAQTKDDGNSEDDDEDEEKINKNNNGEDEYEDGDTMDEGTIDPPNLIEGEEIDNDDRAGLKSPSVVLDY